MALSIVDLIPSLGRYVARNRAGAQQAGLDQSAQAVQTLMGYAPVPAQEGPDRLMSGGMQGAGLMADPTSAANQLRFSQGLMGTAGYGQAGQQFMNSAMQQQLGLPMEQARLGEQMRNNLFGNAMDLAEYDRGTTLSQNIDSMLNHQNPDVRAAFKNYLEKTDSTSIYMPNAAERGFAAYGAEAVQAGIAVDEQLNGGYTPGYADEQLYNLPFGLGNQMISPEYQKYRTNSAAWVQANLRPVSGAVLGPQEVDDNFKTHFPQAGDSEETIEAKRLLRAQKEQSAISRAGSAEAKVMSREDLPEIIQAPVSTRQDGGGNTVSTLPPGAKPVSTRQETNRQIMRDRSALIDRAGQR